VIQRFNTVSGVVVASRIRKERSKSVSCIVFA
jgi:hypothetical protein